VRNKRDLASDCSASLDICTFIWAISATIFSATSFELSASRVASSASSPCVFKALSLLSKAHLTFSNSALESCATSSVARASAWDLSRSESALHASASLSRRCSFAC